MSFTHRTRALFSAAAISLIATGAAFAQESFLDVGKQEPITILINSSP